MNEWKNESEPLTFIKKKPVVFDMIKKIIKYGIDSVL